jgi:predicted Zn-dependent protease
LAAADPTVRTDPQYGRLLAIAYLQLHQPRAAAAALAPLTTHAPGDASLWLRYADVLRQSGQGQAAGEAIYRAFLLDSADAQVRNVAVWLWYARELRQSGRHAAVRVAVLRARAIDPSDPDVRTAARIE